MAHLSSQARSKAVHEVAQVSIPSGFDGEGNRKIIPCVFVPRKISLGSLEGNGRKSMGFTGVSYKNPTSIPWKGHNSVLSRSARIEIHPVSVVEFCSNMPQNYGKTRGKKFPKILYR